MADLAEDLQMMASAYMDHPVVDATGLEGGWDFTMGCTPKEQLQPAQQPNASQLSDQVAAPTALPPSKRSSANSASGW